MITLGDVIRNQPMRRYRVGVVVLLLGAITSGCSFLSAHDLSQRELNADSMAGNIPNTKRVGVQTLPGESRRVGRHVYFGAGIGASHLNPDTDEVTTFGVNDRVNKAGQVTLGMDISRQLSLEVHSVDLGSAGLSPAGRINYHQYGASALVYAGKNRHRYKREGLTGYARLGVGVLSNSAVGDVPFAQENATHLLIGAGVEYMSKLGVGLRAEVISYEEDVQYGQLALVYRMGKRFGAVSEEIVSRPELVEVASVEPILSTALADDICKEVISPAQPVYFTHDSSELNPQSHSLLMAIADKLSSCEAFNLKLVGHTDSIGSEIYNQKLSLKRVRAVKNALVALKVEIIRIKTEGIGENAPSASNATAQGRSQNRRVELFFQNTGNL